MVLAMNAKSAVSNSIHKFPYRWNLTDLAEVKKNGLKVFSCFSCGGGSSMGYKLAGFDVIGNCEIDHDMQKVYLANNHPIYPFTMDLRDFNKSDVPEELIGIDVLDGSPPCSVFSTAGKREEKWGGEYSFREGQAKQRLDDLFFVYSDTVQKLQPKVFVAENVKGLLVGKAKGYVREIVDRFREIGYSVQVFLLNAAVMGVPQARERVFFIGRRNDLNLPQVNLDFREKPILFGEARSEHGSDKPLTKRQMEIMSQRKKGDRNFSAILRRQADSNTRFGDIIAVDDRVMTTIKSTGLYLRDCDGKPFSKQDFVTCQTFPQDYSFGKQSVQYVCGMSVPPVMMAQIAKQIQIQIFGIN